MSDRQSISSKLMNGLTVWCGLGEANLLSAASVRLGGIQRIEQVIKLSTTQVGFCLLTLTSIVETAVYAPMTALSLFFCPFTKQPYKFCAELLKSSSFTILHGIDFFHNKYPLPITKVFVPNQEKQGFIAVIDENQKKMLMQNRVMSIKEEVINFCSNKYGWPYIEHVLQISYSLFCTHLQNINALYDQQELKNIYLEVSQSLKNHQSFLETHINVTRSLSIQQKTLYLTCSQKVHYGDVIKDHTESLFPSLLTLYIYSVHKVYNNKAQLLDIHFKNIQVLEKYSINYLEQYMRNIYICNLRTIDLYINIVHKLKPTGYLRNFQNVNNSLFNLLGFLQNMHIYSPNDLLQSHICNFYNIYNTSSSFLNIYVQTINSLKNTLPELLGVYILHIHDASPSILEDHIRKFCDLDLNPNEIWQEPKALDYLREKQSAYLGLHMYNIYIIIPELLGPYLKATKFLTSELPDLLEFYIYTVYDSSFESLEFYIKITQGLEFDLILLEKYSETIQCMKAVPSYLLGCHIFNIYKMHNNNPQALKRYVETVLFIINEEREHLEKHLYNVFDMQSLFPRLLEEYLQAVQTLKRSSTYLLQLHISCLYHIHNVHKELLERYVKTIKKILHFFSLPNAKETTSWLNTYFQDIANLIFGSAEDLRKHLHLISQMEIIFQGKKFLIKEIIEEMNQEERISFISVSSEIIPYVLAKSIFIHSIQNGKSPKFFTAITRNEINKLHMELKKSQTQELPKIFSSLKSFEKQWDNKSLQPNAIFEKLRHAVHNEYRGMFIKHCWKEAVGSML